MFLAQDGHLCWFLEGNKRRREIERDREEKERKGKGKKEVERRREASGGDFTLARGVMDT